MEQNSELTKVLAPGEVAVQESDLKKWVDTLQELKKQNAEMRQDLQTVIDLPAVLGIDFTKGISPMKLLGKLGAIINKPGDHKEKLSGIIAVFNKYQQVPAVEPKQLTEPKQETNG